MSLRYTATDPAAYERLMGRWSPLLAHELIAFAGLAAGARVLDLGCGTGRAARDRRRRYRADLPRFRRRADDRQAGAVRRRRWRRARSSGWRLRSCSVAHRAQFHAGAGASARCGASRARAVPSRLRSAVWDFPGGLVYQRVFWDTAAALDRTADAARARQYSSPLTHVGELEAAFRAAGLREVAARPLAIRMHYADFADYWQPIAHAQARSATT
jgi:SAM-dependent methyltransferase